MLKKPSEDSLIYCVFKCWKEDFWLKILTLSSTALIIASFIVPPTGIIDPSVMAGSGELLAWGALWQFTKALNKNINAKVKVKELELEINRAKRNGQTNEPEPDPEFEDE
ncbi:MAG: hypothetical protein J6W16_01280 [Methanobrevibacter sp.]|nr:hypothetical protein [Methanobrevibacter sp.]